MNLTPELLDERFRQHDGPLLFIAEARNSLEKRLLTACLDGLAPGHSTAGPAGRLWLTASRDGQLADGTEQARKLDAPGDTLLVPVRVAWLMPETGEKRNKPLPLRHLLFGDPRHPGALRGRWILFRDRKRAECIAGEPDTVDAVQQRFTAQTGLQARTRSICSSG